MKRARRHGGSFCGDRRRRQAQQNQDTAAPKERNQQTQAPRCTAAGRRARHEAGAALTQGGLGIDRLGEQKVVKAKKYEGRSLARILKACPRLTGGNRRVKRGGSLVGALTYGRHKSLAYSSTLNRLQLSLDYFCGRPQPLHLRHLHRDRSDRARGSNRHRKQSRDNRTCRYF